MNDRLRLLVILPLAACCLGLDLGSARAECTISVTGVRFGSYDVFSPLPLDSTGTIVFLCGKQDRRIRISLSTGSSGTYATRTMRSGADILSYNLFIDGLTTIWGDGTGSTGVYFNNNPRNDEPVPLTVFGRVPALQDAGPGVYSDNIQVVIDF